MQKENKVIITNKLDTRHSAIATATHDHAHALTKYIGILILRRVAALFAGQTVKITASRCHSLIKLI